MKSKLQDFQSNKSAELSARLERLEELSIQFEETKSKLERKEELYYAALSNIPLGLLTTDRSGMINYVNPIFTEIIGLSSEHVVGKIKINSSTIFNNTSVNERLRNMIAKEIPVDMESVLITTHSGKSLYLQFQGIPIKDIQNKTISFLILIKEISQQKQFEEQFRQSQKLESIGRLAGGIAHDFNNLLTIINGYSELVLSNLDNNDPLKSHVKQIAAAGERAEMLTQQLLAFGRKQILQPKMIDLNKMLNNIEKVLKHQIDDSIDLKIILEPNLGYIKTDPHQIEQVVTNLINNARDAMPGGGKLTIETKNVILDKNYIKNHPIVKSGSYVMLAISDTGIGMDKSTKVHIFEPFFTTKEKGKGTGLGLATVYGIVKQSEGYIWVYSELGEGTAFKIYLPRIDDLSLPVEKPSVYKHDMKGTETILVVEDEEDVRNLVCEMLRFYGYNILEASQAGTALTIFEQYTEEIHLILSDVVMPQMSGQELVEQILSIQPNIKVIYMSGYTDNAVVRNGILNQGENFIQKPFSPVDLIRKVREVLDSTDRL